jgi:DNA polymerase III delta subunit
MSDLINEVEKISLGISQGKRISCEDVQAVVGRYRTENMFALLDQVGRGRDPAEFIRKLDRLIDSGEEPVFILAMLLRRVIQLLQVKSLQAEQGGRPPSPQDLTTRLKLNPYASNTLLRQAKDLHRKDLELLLENLRWADMTLKTSAIPPKYLLEEAFFAAAARKKLATSANLF